MKNKTKICISCSSKVPKTAQKCSQCGEDLRSGFIRYFWKIISFTITICTLIFVGWQSYNLNQQTNIIKKQFELEYVPVIKISAISLNAVPYTETTGNQSIAVYFSIPIENKHGFAYDVKIVEKTLDLRPYRDKYGLETPSLQSPLTSGTFDLSNGQIRYDRIGIDIPNLEKYLKGEASFILKYRIEYRAMPEVTKDVFIYNYDVAFTNGRFEIIKEKIERKSNIN